MVDSGISFIRGALLSRGFTGQRCRVIDTLRRVDPISQTLRRSVRIYAVGSTQFQVLMLYGKNSCNVCVLGLGGGGNYHNYFSVSLGNVHGQVSRVMAEGSW